MVPRRQLSMSTGALIVPGRQLSTSTRALTIPGRQQSTSIGALIIPGRQVGGGIVIHLHLRVRTKRIVRHAMYLGQSNCNQRVE